jgi:septation ring formation regulator EzrA
MKRSIAELKQELTLLVNQYERNEKSLDETLVKFERLIKDFQVITQTKESSFSELRYSFKQTLLRIRNMNLIDVNLKTGINQNNEIRLDLGLA